MLDKQKNRGTPQPYLRNPNVQWFNVDLDDLQEMPFEDHEDEKYGLREGDVVICEGGEAGRAAIWDGSIPGMKIQKAIHRVRPKEDLYNRYLVYQLMADYQSGRLADYYTGTTIKHLTGKDLALYEFPLPPLPEQKRIAAILDKADAIRRKRQQAIQLPEQFLRSTFLDMFGDPVTNPKGWPVKKVKDLCEIVRGSSPRPKADPKFYGGPVPRLMVADIARDGWLVTPRIDSLTVEGAKRSRPVPAGTIVMAVSGNVGLMSELAIGACVHDGFVAFTHLKTDQIEPKYLMLCLHFLKMTHETRKAGAIFQNLTTHDIKSLDIPLPPMEVQLRYLQAFSGSKALEARLKATPCAADNLFNSLVQRAFRGEL